MKLSDDQHYIFMHYPERNNNSDNKCNNHINNRKNRNNYRNNGNDDNHKLASPS